MLSATALSPGEEEVISNGLPLPHEGWLSVWMFIFPGMCTHAPRAGKQPGNERQAHI